MLDAPRRLARQSTTIQRDQPVDLIQQPRDPGHGPGPHRPSGRPPSGQRQGDGARTTHFRPVSRDRPRRHGRLFRGDERLRIEHQSAETQRCPVAPRRSGAGSTGRYACRNLNTRQRPGWRVPAESQEAGRSPCSVSNMRLASTALTSRANTASGWPTPLMTTRAILVAVVLNQRERLLLVEVQTPVDRIRGVVLALQDVAATHITNPRARIVARGRVVGAAVPANTAR